VWVSPTGTKTWRYRYRFHTDKHAQEITIGQFPAIKYEQARLSALAYEQAKAAGHDPEITAWKAHRSRATTVGDVIDYHLKKLADKNTSTHYHTAKLYKDLKKHHHDTSVADFEASVLRSWIINHYSQRAGAGLILLRNLTAAFNHAMRPISGLAFPAGYENPAAKMRAEIPFLASYQPSSFARTFAEEDIGRMFRAIEKAYSLDINPMGVAAIELCLLTGCRPSEATGLRWDEIGVRDGMTIIKKGQHKTMRKGKARVIRVFGDAEKVFQRAREFRAKMEYDGVYVFPVDRKRKDGKREHVWQLGHYASRIAPLTAEAEDQEPLTFVPYNLRSGFINFALDLLGEDHIALVAENVGHDVETCRRYYRRHKEANLAAAALKVSEGLARARLAV
jgi:integrase